jgi:hypothetical protein
MGGTDGVVHVIDVAARDDEGVAARSSMTHSLRCKTHGGINPRIVKGAEPAETLGVRVRVETISGRAASWANCLDQECEIDPTNPALRQRVTVKTGESKTFGGGCDTATRTTIWPGTAQHRKGMEQLGRPVDFPETCSSAAPSTTSSTTPTR